MAAASAVWDRNQFNNSTGKEEKLFLFGYSCKIFRDDEKASYITQGKHLIPWMGDENLWIDRYDVRGYLHDLKPYETNPGVKYEDPLAEEEKLCDEERYLALKSNLTEEQLYQEEELKRLRAAVASDGAYHEIGFTYDNETYNEPSTVPKVEDPEDDLFEIPSGLEIPKGMEVPYNMKIHAIIEKTALFICEHGGQMEIIIKMKQQSNPQFAFMHLDNPLYPYYKHLVKEIKAGHYKPIQVKRVVQSEDEDDGHYLHPSLMAGKAEDVPKFTVPSINFRRTDNDSYSVLVKNLQQQIIEDTRSNSPHYCAEPAYYSDPSSTETGNSLSLPSGSEDIDALKVVIPPPSIQPVIDKMAEYVAKNGEDFEFVVRSKKDKRFDFLIPGNEYYPYYIQKRNACKKPSPAPEPKLPVKKKKKSKMASQPLQPYQSSKKVSHTIDDEPEIVSCDSKDTEDACEPISTSDPEVNYEGPSFDDSVIALDSNCQHSGQTTIENSPVLLETEQQPVSMEDLTESVLSPKADDGKVKSLAHKVVKGPISFSLKSKDVDCQNLDKPKRLRLDDSEEEVEDQQQQSVTEAVKSKKLTSSESRTTIVSRNHSAESEEKSVTNSSENVEAKLTEEKIKERLLAGAREKRAVQKREKQLQLERKRKAALFLKMLEKEKKKETAAESPERSMNQKESTPNQRDSTPPPKADASDLKIPGLGFSPETRSMEEELLMHVKIPGLDIYPDASDITSPKNGDLISHSATNSISSLPQSPAQPPDKHPLSSPSPSDTTEDELYSTSPPKITSTIEISTKHRHRKSSKKKDKKKEKKKKKEKEKEKEKEKKKSIPAKYLLRTPSPPRNHKQEKVKRDKEKEKALPAAYANIRRSRSHSRSPKRYRSEPRLPSPKRWIRRRM